MKTKKCTGCKKIKELKCFGKQKGRKYGLRTMCKVCRSIESKLYYKNNKERLVQYRENNKEWFDHYQKQWCKNNRKRIAERSSKYREVNKKRLSKQKKEYNNNYAKYNSYKDKLTIDESPRVTKDGISLEVLCRYCGEYFKPINSEVSERVRGLCHINTGDYFLYCSQGCKDSCSTYGQKLYPKGFKKATSREVNPLVRQLCFERDNWQCQICGATQEDAPLHCHHIEGVAQNPRLGNDVTNTITLCKSCHKEVHKLPGCEYNKLKCSGVVV